MVLQLTFSGNLSEKTITNPITKCGYLTTSKIVSEALNTLKTSWVALNRCWYGEDSCLDGLKRFSLFYDECPRVPASIVSRTKALTPGIWNELQPSAVCVIMTLLSELSLQAASLRSSCEKPVISSCSSSSWGHEQYMKLQGEGVRTESHPTHTCFFMTSTLLK